MESRVQGVHIVTLIHHLSHFVTFASIFSVPLCLFLHTHPLFFLDEPFESKLHTYFHP